MTYSIYALYKLDDIVYIGMSINVKSRLSNHRRKKDFDNHEVLEEFNSKYECQERERELIEQFRPILNIQHNPTYNPIVKFKSKQKPKPVTILPIRYTQRYRSRIAGTGYREFEHIPIQPLVYKEYDMGTIENGVIKIPYIHDLNHLDDAIMYYLEKRQKFIRVETESVSYIRNSALMYMRTTKADVTQNSVVIDGLLVVETR